MIVHGMSAGAADPVAVKTRVEAKSHGARATPSRTALLAKARAVAEAIRDRGAPLLNPEPGSPLSDPDSPFHSPSCHDWHGASAPAQGGTAKGGGAAQGALAGYLLKSTEVQIESTFVEIYPQMTHPQNKNSQFITIAAEH